MSFFPGVFQSPLHVFVLLFFLISLVYGRVLHHPFMLEDEMIFGYWFRPLNMDSLLACFDPGARNIIYFRPVVSLFNLFLYNMAGTEVVFYRMTTLVLFFGFLVTVYFFTKRLFRDQTVAALTVLLFAVHPINSLYINPLSCSAILIWGIFFVGALSAYLKFAEGQKAWLWISYALLILAFATHEMAVTLPGFIFLLNILSGNKWPEAFWKTTGYVILVAGLMMGRSLIVPATGGMYAMVKTGTATLGLDGANYIATLGALVGWYLQQLLWPTEILLIKTVPVIKTNVGMVNLWVAGILVVLVIILAKLRDIKWNFLVFWLAVGFAPLAAATLIYPFEGLTIEPNWFMVGSLAFFWAMALAFQTLSRIFGPLMSVGALSVILISAAIYTQKYNEIWSSQRSYCLYWLSLQPTQQIANFWLGLDYMKTGEFCLAKEHFKRALNGSFVDWEVFVNLGVIALQEGNLAEAVEWSQKALRINAQSAEALSNLGAVAWQNGRIEEAKDLYRKAIAADRSFTNAAENLKIISNQRQ